MTIKFLKVTYNLVSLSVLFFGILPVISYNTAQFQQEMDADESAITAKSLFNKDIDDTNCNVIKVGKLKAQRVLAQCIDAKKIDTECIDADNVRAHDVSAEKAYLAALCTQTICADQFVASTVDTQSVRTNNLSAAGDTCLSNLSILGAVCASSLNAESACITGTLLVNNFLNCGKYRATVVTSTNITYTLGTPIDWDVVLDDPNGDVTLFPSFAYTAPVSGYYIATLQVDQDTLQPFNNLPILGVPVSNPQIYVNGLVLRQSYVPYLTFFNNQKTTLTSIISLKAGDVITTKFEVLALNQFNGVVPVAGTVSIEGNGTEGDESIFKISLLNVDCLDLPCTPCTPSPCTPNTPLTCGPCTGLPACDPCTPCIPCQCC